MSSQPEGLLLRSSKYEEPCVPKKKNFGNFAQKGFFAENLQWLHFRSLHSDSNTHNSFANSIFIS